MRCFCRGIGITWQPANLCQFVPGKRLPTVGELPCSDSGRVDGVVPLETI
jgi:hypothetical protein